MCGQRSARAAATARWQAMSASVTTLPSALSDAATRV
jgi:hypothetical protein